MYVPFKKNIVNYSSSSESDSSFCGKNNNDDNDITTVQDTENIETNNISELQSCSASTNLTQKKRVRKKQEEPKTRKRLRDPKTWIRRIEISKKKTKGE